MDIDEVISTNIRISILRRRLSQKHLSERLGMTLPALQNRLSGRVEWRVKEVEQVAHVLDVDLSALFSTENAVAHQEGVTV